MRQRRYPEPIWSTERNFEMPHPIGADPASAPLATVALASVVLGPVLHDLPFPADAWQVLTQAEIYGADATTRVALRALPAGRYRNVRAIAAALTAAAPVDHARAQRARSPQSLAPHAPRRR